MILIKHKEKSYQFLIVSNIFHKVMKTMVMMMILATEETVSFTCCFIWETDSLVSPQTPIHSNILLGIDLLCYS